MSFEFNTGSLRNTLFSKTPGNVHVVPPSVVNPQPPCRKLDDTLLNCRQPIVILLPSVGSTAIEHSLAASPMMLFPLLIDVHLIADEWTKLRDHARPSLESVNERRRVIVFFQRLSLNWLAWRRLSRNGGK